MSILWRISLETCSTSAAALSSDKTGGCLVLGFHRFRSEKSAITSVLLIVTIIWVKSAFWLTASNLYLRLLMPSLWICCLATWRRPHLKGRNDTICYCKRKPNLMHAALCICWIEMTNVASYIWPTYTYIYIYGVYGYLSMHFVDIHLFKKAFHMCTTLGSFLTYLSSI